MVNNILKSLSSESDFKKLRVNGKKKRLEPWLLLVFSTSSDSFCYIGFSINSRFLSAVKRNRVKRVFRQSLRLIDGKAKGYMFHFIVTRKVSSEEWSLFHEKKSVYYLTEILKWLDGVPQG